MKKWILFLFLFFSTLGYSQFVPIAVFEIKKPEGLTYSSVYWFNKWYAITTVTPTMSNYDDKRTLTFSISPTLPAGLSFNTATGQITGTPTEYDEPGTLYTITVSNQAGSDQTTTTIHVIPANHTWSGNAFPDTNWTTGGNWIGMNPPTASDRAVFDDYCSVYGAGCNATINANIDIEEIQMKSDYPGTITQSGAFTINLGNDYRTDPNGINMEGGTFVGGSGNITMDVLQLTAGNFTSTSGTLRIGYNAAWASTEASYLRSGVTWSHNNGTVIFDPTGNNSAYRRNHQIDLDQEWFLYNLEFDIDSSTTLSDGEISGHYMDILGTSRTFNVANDLHFRDGWARYGTLKFYGSNVTFHCDAPTYDKCSDTIHDINSISFTGIAELHFLGSTAQTYTYDAGADSWAEFVINNSNGVTTASTGNFSVPGVKIDAGNFSAPSGSNLYLYKDANYNHNANSGGFEINGTGTFTHNNSTVIVHGSTSYGDDREALTFTDNVTFYNLTINVQSGTINSYSHSGVDIQNNVTLTILNDLRIIDGSIDGGGSNANIIVRGDFYRECSQLQPTLDCASDDDGTLNYIFDTSGSQINIATGADQHVASGNVVYRIDPGAGGTVTLNGVLTTVGSGNNLDIVSGTFHMNAGAGVHLGDDLINNGAVTCAANVRIHYRGTLSGTPGGGNNATCYTNTIPDATLPGAFGWANFSGNSSEETVSSVYVAVRLRIAVTHTTGTPTIQYRSSNTNWATVGNGSFTTQEFINGETLQFRATGTSGDQATITVVNIDDGNSTVDVITATVP